VRGSVVALPDKGWWKLRLDCEETVRSARRTKFAPLGGEAPPPTPAPADEPPAPAPAPTPQEDEEHAPTEKRGKGGVEMRRVGDTAWRCFKPAPAPAAPASPLDDSSLRGPPG